MTTAHHADMRPNAENSTPPTRRQSFIRRHPLRLALGLIGGWVFIILHAHFFFQWKEKVYPLWLAATSPHRWMILGGLALTVIALHVVAIRRRQWGKVLVSSLVQVVLFASALLFGSSFVGIHQQTIAVGSHTYHLVYGESPQSLAQLVSHHSYVVMECDPTGMFCHQYGVPYSRTLSCFVSGGRLEVDPSTETLILRVEGDPRGEVYETDAFELGSLDRGAACHNE
jgi:hypothetical protein